MTRSTSADSGTAPLRVAVFHDLPSGGAKRTLQAQVSGLVARGHRVDCFTTSAAEEDLFPLREVAHSLIQLPVPKPPNREAALAGRPSARDLVGWMRVFRGIREVGKEVARRVDRADYHVLLAHPSQFTQAPHVLSWSSTPTVYYCHEVLRAAYETGLTSPAVRTAIRLTLGKLDRRNVRGATAIAVNSGYTGRRVHQVYGRTSTVVPPGVDSRCFRPSEAPQGDYLLAVGALHPLKGMGFIVEALARLDPRYRPPLVIVSDRGRKAERSALREQAEGLGVRVEHRERVGEEELASLYAGARALLFAARHEPLGLAPLEAMASGVPVVAVAEGGVPETVVDGSTGYLVPRDPGSFAAALSRLLDDPEKARDMGRNGRAHVEAHWSWDLSVDRLIRLLKKTVNPS